jgi:hypothetical protein
VEKRGETLIYGDTGIYPRLFRSPECGEPGSPALQRTYPGCSAVVLFTFRLVPAWNPSLSLHLIPIICCMTTIELYVLRGLPR